MMIFCRAKKCNSEDDHLLDQTDNTVYCIKCGAAIDVPQPTKVALKSMGQVQRQVKKALTFACKACGKNCRPEIRTLSGVKSEAFCTNCGKKMDISGPFIEAIKSLPAEQDDG